MIKEICFATNNKNKLVEIQTAVGDRLKVVGLKDIGCTEDIPETGITLKENALIKAQYVFDTFHISCFADDTGLEIEALNDEPGVYSARYAGPACDSEKNMDKVLDRLKGVSNRKAQFVTMIALIINGQVTYFDGIATGVIREARSGSKGFGYDAIFQPDGFDYTFAEMQMEEKNTISHRGKATRKLLAYLNSL